MPHQHVPPLVSQVKETEIHQRMKIHAKGGWLNWAHLAEWAPGGEMKVLCTATWVTNSGGRITNSYLHHVLRATGG